MNKYQISTILINALMTEVTEISTSVKDTAQKEVSSEEGISIPVNKEVSELQNGDGSRHDLTYLVKSINHDCSSIKCTLGDSLRIAAEATIMDTSASIYGCIWASTANPNIRINVLHPIAVHTILKGDFDNVAKLEDDGTLYVYEYSSKLGSYIQNTSHADYVIERWVEVLSVLATESYPPNTQLKCSTNMDSLCNNLRSGNTSIESARVDFSESGNNPRLVITPLLFVTKDMLFPYYGAIISRSTGGEYSSRDLMPWGSCNLNHRENIGRWGGTCTGSFSNAVYSSLRVLTNVNTGSPHHTDVILKSGCPRTYARVTQEMSASMLFDHFKDVWEVQEEVIEAVSEDTTEEVTVITKKRGRPSKKVEA
jgi:hypothetical protein